MIYRVNATALSPLSFRNNRNTTDTETLNYIPGISLLASLVNVHHLMRNDVDELNQMLLQGVKCMGNLYPAIESGTEDAQLKLVSNILFPVYPLPTTARSCKRFGGFHLETTPWDEKHGVSDQLCHWGLFELSGRTNIEPLKQHQKCGYDGCNENLDRIEGFYRRGYEATHLAKPKTDTMLRMHTGIDRATGTVKQGILYGRSVLPEDREFWGTVQVDDDVADEFEEFVEEASEAKLIRVGNNRTRGLGKLHVEVSEHQLDTLEDLKERIQAFDAHFKQFAQDSKIDTPHTLYLPITLTSDVILLDDILRHVTSLSPQILGIEEAELIYANLTSRRVNGWNTMLGLPKPDDMAIGMGSVFLFGLNTPLDETLLETLLDLETNGLGIRRQEGFGQIIVASQFHYEVNNV